MIEAPTARTERDSFVQHVAHEFERAGVEYVVLHAYDSSTRKDSDVDLAVGRESLSTVDALVRTGTFGRLLQRLDYDIPWCRYYVVESQETGRRYRQLDVACDPWGIGKYGSAVPIALALPDRSSGLARPNAAAETYYLAVKRARKSAADTVSLADLRGAFARDPIGSSDLLRQQLGGAGATLAAALATEKSDLTAELRAVRDSTGRHRRAGAQFARRAMFSSARIARRVARPTGLVVSLAGPDGSGKSTLAAGLEVTCLGAFRRSFRLHSGPGLLPPPARLLGRPVSDGTDPHARPPSGRLGSLARVGYLWLDHVLGWPPRVWRPRIHSSLVVLERGWLDLFVDPRRYRLSVPPSLIRGLGRLVPRPELTLILDAPPTQIAVRKSELDAFEMDRQLSAWRALAGEARLRMTVIDASKTPDQVLEDSLEVIHAQLAARHPDFRAAAIALECTGAPSPRGSRFVLVQLGGRPRWLMPARFGAAGPLRAGLYRPAQLRHRLAGLTVDAGHAVGRGSAVRLDPERGIAPPIADALGVDSLRVTGAALARDGGSRVVLKISRNEKTIAFAKVDVEREPLEHERRVLEELARIGPKTFVAPRVLGSLEWHGFTVLVLEPLSLSGRSDRILAEPEIAALEELSQLTDDLAQALGLSHDLVPAHGDFAPWNSGRTRPGRLALWDWERAYGGAPLEDFFHWHVQRIVLLSAGTVDDLVIRTLSPDRDMRALCARLSVPYGEAPLLLRSYLERSAGPLAPTSKGARVRFRAIELLDRARS